MTISVFDFKDAVDYMCCLMDDKKRRNSRYSLRSWSKQLGDQSPSYISQVTRRLKPMSPELAHRISEMEELDSASGAYLEVLALSQSNATDLRSVIASMNPTLAKEATTNISQDAFPLIADWFHVVLFEMTKLKSFSTWCLPLSPPNGLSL